MKKLLLLLLFFASGKLFACHGIVLVSPSVTTSGGNIVIDASSDPASCGCGPYWLQVELSYSNTFTANPPAPASPAWGTFPWYHSLLNVAGYGPPNWVDNCVPEPYTTINIPMSSLCPGSTVYVRMREWVEGSNSAGPWTIAASIAVPGPAPVLSGTAIALNNALCAGDTTQLSVTHNGCSGNYSVSWTPTSGLTNPTAITTAALPAATTTYTVSFTDVALAQTFTATVTVMVSPPLLLTSTSTIESCNQSDAVMSLAVSGGTMPYSYLWSTAHTTATVTGVSSGAYVVMVTDSFMCLDSLLVIVTDSCDYVWPGDANDDAVADINDILAIGIANGANGTTRPAATINWIGQPSQNWGPVFSNGSDYKFGDCNGDGTIDPNDTSAVIQNWGMTHNNRFGNEATAVDPVLMADFIPDTVGSSSAGVLQVSLGDAVTPVNAIYGISFRLNYDEQYIDPASIGLYPGNSWIAGTGNRMAVRVVNAGSGSADIAITRLNQSDTSGNGVLLDIYFTTTDTIAGTGLTVDSPISVSHVNMITANETQQAVNVINDTLVITDGFALETQENAGQETMDVYPNPTSGVVTITLPYGHADRVVLTDLAGRELSAEGAITGNQFEIDLSGAAAGIYFISVYEDGAQQTIRIVKE